MMRRLAGSLALLLLASCGVLPASSSWPETDLPPFRAPAVPLFVQTPYLHTWLCGDRLADEAPKLWNGQIKGMAGMLQIDGKTYRFLGLPTSPLPALRQDSVRILPTRSVFEFSQDDVRLSLEFLSPMDPRDLRLLSLPAGLLRAEVSAATPHAIRLYLDITGEWAVGSSDRRITWDGLFRIHPSQPRLFRETYNYPDWGDVHWTAVDPANSVSGVQADVRQSFVKNGAPQSDTRYPRAANDEWPVFAHQWDLGQVQKPVVRRALLLHARRDVVDFYGTACRAYWTRHYADGAAMAASVATEFESIRARSAAVDREVLARAQAAGGPALAKLAALAFRQSFASNELALYGDQIFYFAKSMDLSGASAIQSLDVIYPASPALLAFNPALLRMQLAPIVEALRRGDWHEPHAMSDLGAYPAALGQIAPGSRPASSTQFAILSRLAGGPAHPDAEPDRSGPREQIRVDLFIDRLINPARVSDEAITQEIAEVRAKAGKYGTPFDLKKPTVRVDALLWIAALAPPAVRERMLAEVVRAYAETPARVPAPDQYEADTARPAATQGRPVLGAVFAPLLLPAAPVER